ncbi:MAG: tRNA-guanine transglycosylase [Patescibacteria group bacterium]
MDSRLRGNDIITMKQFGFRILEKDKKTKARVGEIYTPHGTIKTPAFVPVGTQGSVKSLTPEEMKETGVQLFFVNTYHMYLRPVFSLGRSDWKRDVSCIEKEMDIKL